MMTAVLLAVLCLMFCIPAFAADLSVKVDRLNKTFTITNARGSDIYVQSLPGSGKDIPVNTKLNAGATASFELKAPPPKTMTDAKCVISGAPSGTENKCSVNYQIM